MTLDEAIKRYTSNAFYEKSDGNLQGHLEFNQLAEWLKNYKRLLKQEPKKGHWIETKSDGHCFPRQYTCSECGWKFDTCRGLLQSEGHRLFCEHCGADMRGDAK